MKSASIRLLRAAALALLLAAVPSMVHAQWNYTTLDYPSATNTSILATNGTDHVGCYYTGPAGNLGPHHSFILAGGSNWVALDYPGATETKASGIDLDGTVVGSYSDTGGVHSFIRSPEGAWSSFDIPGAIGTSATAISDGVVVGSYWDASNEVHGFKYYCDDQYFRTLDYGVLGTWIADINSSGLIVGHYADLDGVAHGFTADTGTFGDWYTVESPEGAGTMCFGIDELNNFCGWQYSGTAGGIGFVYSDCADWTTLSIGSYETSVNDLALDRGILVGDYSDDGATYHGFVATRVPEPGSIALLVSGVFGLLAYAWRKRAS